MSYRARYIRSALLAAAAGAALAAALLLSAGAAANAQEIPQELRTTTISGRVMQGTPGVELTATIPVRLSVIAVSEVGITGIELSSMETVTDANGEFEFANIEVIGDICRVIVLAQFYTPSVDIDDCVSTDDVELVIWDTTDDLSEVRLLNYRVTAPVINGDDRVVLFLGSATVWNAGDAIWVSDLDDPNFSGLDLLRFNLPEGFFELTVEEGVPMGVDEGLLGMIPTGFSSITPIIPQQMYQVLFSFGIMYDETTLTWPVRLPHGADDVEISVPTGLASLEGNRLTFDGSVEIAGREFDRYRGDNYAPGEALNLRFSGLPEPSIAASVGAFFSSGAVVWAAVATVAVLVTAAAVILVVRRRRAGGDSDIDLDLID